MKKYIPITAIWIVTLVIILVINLGGCAYTGVTDINGTPIPSTDIGHVQHLVSSISYYLDYVEDTQRGNICYVAGSSDGISVFCFHK